MSTFPNITPEQQQQALAMALLTGGAQMMNPVGSFGNAGAQFSRGVQQGMGTFMPMMQFYQQSNLAKEDRDYKKKQDKFRNRMDRNQMQLAEMQFQAMENQREFTREYQNKSYSLMERKYQAELDRLEQQQQMMGQFMKYATEGVPNPAAAGQMGPRVGNDPTTGLPPGVPATVPMTPMQFYTGKAALGATGADIGGMTGMDKAMFPTSEVGSPNYNRTARQGMLIQQIMHGTPEQKAAAQKELDLMKQYSTSNFDALGAEMAKAMQGIR